MFRFVQRMLPANEQRSAKLKNTISAMKACNENDYLMDICRKPTACQSNWEKETQVVVVVYIYGINVNKSLEQILLFTWKSLFYRYLFFFLLGSQD